MIGVIIGRNSRDKSDNEKVVAQAVLGDRDTSEIEVPSTTTGPKKDLSSPATYNPSMLGYLSTFRSCLGKECFDSPVRYPDGSSGDRIGLLSPMMSGGDPLRRYLDNMLKRMSRRKIYLIHEMHVPAYGYGKNHGWSRIIRLSRRLFPHAYALTDHSNVGAQESLAEIYGAQVNCKLIL
jgi:hypothetical protein